jgi:methionyl-tRNA formyltransferase
MAGDDATGVSIMRVTAGLDSGPVCLVRREPIAPGDSYGSLAERLQRIGGELLVEALDESPPFVEQDERLVTYADKIVAADRLLDATRPARELERAVRALAPHIGAAVELPGGARLGVWEAVARPPAEGDPAPGELSTTAGAPVLGCTPGTLELVTVQPAGRRAMPGGAYVRGLRG